MQVSKPESKSLNQKGNTVRKSNNRTRSQYSIKDVRQALYGMLEGKSARAMEEHYLVPRSTLMRHFRTVTGVNANIRIQSLTKIQISSMMEKIKAFDLPQCGDNNKYFTRDEEEMFVVMLEEAHNCAFPYDKEALKAMVSRAGRVAYGKVHFLHLHFRVRVLLCLTMIHIHTQDFKVTDSWVRRFEKRWSDRLTKVKCSSIDKHRANKANAEVRDAVMKEFVRYLDDLVQRKEFTPEQVSRLDEHMCNGDEVGGDEKGKSKSKVYAPKGRNAACWRSTDLAGDHNPFHVTYMIVSIAKGI